ncbi:uncharacterized protein [Diabrotica undecimpunctata]|uniref:uncharacterized protein isoform X2 n=1 Tax=Diabrotica undecimpunctata TaxID=50387 RepID=UPI003B63D571
MKQLYFFICIGILNTINFINATDNNVNEYKEICVKVYYVGDGFYNVNCFAYLSNNDFGIVTNKNDTIVATGVQKGKQCFKIISGQHNRTSVACMQDLYMSCEETGAKIKDITKLNEIPCRFQASSIVSGISFEKIHVIFGCKISFEKTQIIDSNETVIIKYCKSPPLNEDRMEEIDDNNTHSFIAYFPDRFPKRE